MSAFESGAGWRHCFDPTTLREYDIRGIVGQTLHESDAYAVGRCFGAWLAARHPQGGVRVAVGFDGRLTSARLEACLVDGLKASHATVLRIGRGPTPMLYYAAATLATEGAVMVTGSHNPPDHNGFKIVAGGKPFYGASIASLGAMAQSGAVTPRGLGAEQQVELREAYVQRLAQDWDGGARALNVVWDNGNGAAGEVLQALVRRLPGRHELLFETIDGRFPNHHPDPTVPANLQALIAQVRARGADLGIAFDGDADRIGVVDDAGNILFGDQILILLARDVLRAAPGATIISDVKASQVLFDEIARAGGVPLMWKTGHSLIKAKMADTGAKLAAEMSGHVFFADRWYGFDDALYAAVRLLGVVARQQGRLSAALAALPRVVNTPELRFDCADTRKFAVVAEVAARLAAAGADVTALDGVRVRTEDGWWLLRASNTQAVLVARAEADDPEKLGRLTGAIGAQLAQSGVAVPPALRNAALAVR